MMKESASVKEILNRPDKGVQGAQNVLTRLWRTILLELNIGNERFNGLMSTYLRDPNNGIKDDPNARANNRGNLVKELGGDRMTFQVFEKGLRVLGVKQFKLIIQIQRKDTFTEHEIHVVNNIQTEEPPEDLSNAKVIKPFNKIEEFNRAMDNATTVEQVPSTKHRFDTSFLRTIPSPKLSEDILNKVNELKSKAKK